MIRGFDRRVHFRGQPLEMELRGFDDGDDDDDDDDDDDNDDDDDDDDL